MALEDSFAGVQAACAAGATVFAIPTSRRHARGARGSFFSFAHPDLRRALDPALDLSGGGSAFSRRFALSALAHQHQSDLLRAAGSSCTNALRAKSR